MKISIIISMLVLGGIIISGDESDPKNLPKYLELDIDWNAISQSEVAFEFENPDTSITHTMHLLRNADGLPMLYYTDVLTPVCIDGVCKPVYVEMYWDLYGQYAGYGEYPDQVFSKFDHDDFESKDYDKLHTLLGDSYSVLGRRKLTQLYDISQERKVLIKFKGQEIDGVSGATKKEIKTAIVEGALYSCYTLWHIVHGSASKKIKDKLPEIYSDKLEDEFLNSNHKEYQLFAIENLESNRFKNKIDQLLQIAENGTPLTRKYILKKMPKELFGHKLVIDNLYKNLSGLDLNTRTLLIKNLSHSNHNAALAMSTQLDILSKNQLKNYLQQIDENSAFRTEKLLKNLERTDEDKNFAFAYLVKQFLQKG